MELQTEFCRGNFSRDAVGQNKFRLWKEIWPVVIGVVAVVFNVLIILTYGHRRLSRRIKLEWVEIQFCVLAVTDILASVAIVAHVSERIFIWSRGDIKAALAERFVDNSTVGGFVAAGDNFSLYVGPDFFLVIRNNKSCSYLLRYFTARYFTDGLNRIVFVYINVAKIAELYWPRLPLPDGEGSRLRFAGKLLCASSVSSAVFMVIWISIFRYAVDRAKEILGVVLSIYYFIPFVVLVAATVLLFRKLQQQKKTLRRLDRASLEHRRERIQRQLKTMILVITLAYLLCHLPGLVYTISKEFSLSKKFRSIASRVSTSTLALNSLVNFPLFVEFSSEFRKSLRHLFGFVDPHWRIDFPR